MTLALLGYSGIFMRYALAVQPKNYLLFGCHVVNFTAQSTQAYRYINYRYMGGQQAALEAKAKEGLGKAEGEMDRASAGLKSAGEGVKDAARSVESGARELAGDVVEKVQRSR